MLGNNNVKTYTKMQTAMENDIVNRFPAISKHINAIHFDNAKFGGDLRSSGLYMNVDSKVCDKEATPKGFTPNAAYRVEMSDATKRYIDKTMDSLISSGMSEEDAHKKVQDSLEPVMGYDASKKQYVLSAVSPNAYQKDSLLEQTSIPMWNIGFMNRIIKQPFATSHAKNLVSIESFSNPFADVIGLFKESFEGFGKISSTARGNFKQNNSNPVTNEASVIMEDVVNISVDYESDLMEDLQAQQKGNFITGQIKADREKYAHMVLDRLHDALIYFGSDEAGLDGLADVATPEVYTGTPLYDILNGTSANPGSDIVLAMNKLMGDFMRESHYMSREISVCVSEYVYQALTQTVYSKTYSPDSPLKVLQGNFNVRNQMGDLVQVKYNIVPDTMLNPSTDKEVNPFNPNKFDWCFITTSKIHGAMGDENSLVIAPELLHSYIAPAMYTRSGFLYTNYRRIAGVIAPIEGTVKAVQGLGYQED